jgi:putative spermidine/putrescine transport system ATP-binding protein
MSFVAVQNFAKSFGAVSVFADIDLDVAEGEICILLGPSGCGKTTLLRAIAGLVQQDRGTLSIAGQDVSRLSPAQRGVAMTFQHYALFPNMTVRQNLAFGLERKRLAKSEVVRKVDAALALMELGPRADARPGQLSGGQKQRVALARALVLEPRLLLLDEPLSALDAQIRKRLRDELKRIQRETGLTSILVTHDQEEALVLGDRVAVMNAGRIVQVDAARTLYDRPVLSPAAACLGHPSGGVRRADEHGRQLCAARHRDRPARAGCHRALSRGRRRHRPEGRRVEPDERGDVRPRRGDQVVPRPDATTGNP